MRPDPDLCSERKLPLRDGVVGRSSDAVDAAPTWRLDLDIRRDDGASVEGTANQFHRTTSV